MLKKVVVMSAMMLSALATNGSTQVKELPMPPCFPCDPNSQSSELPMPPCFPCDGTNSSLVG